MCDKEKRIHVKPNFYTYCFEELKIIAKRYGYNLVIHGSMNRDMDLIAIPWNELFGTIDSMIKEFAEYLGAEIMPMTDKQKYCFPNGRYSYVLNMCRRKFDNGVGVFRDDREYYLDISIIPVGVK